VHTERTRTPVVEEEESGEEMEDGTREDVDEGTRTETED
jgi:hypothetical protein